MGSREIANEELHERLADVIPEFFKECHGFGGGEFLPAGIYSNPKLLNAELVRRELGLSSSQDEPLVDFVLTRAPKIFVNVNCWATSPEQARCFMQQFMDSNFSDDNLPISMESCKTNPAFSSKSWSLGWKKRFCKDQWDHMAPVFSHRNFICRLDQQQRLPFLKPDQAGGAPQGASSIVHQVKVHEDHLEEPPLDYRGQRRDIAIKEIRIHDTEFTEFQAQFNNEAKALMDIRDLKHPHIIQWLGAFTRGPEHYLMFPWADGGSLRDFWKRQNPARMDTNGIRDLVWEALNQFRGLADALLKLHVEKFYRHGDVKPENILRFLDGKTTTGILQIADFGLAKQHNGPTMRRGPTATRHTTLQYESPEAEEAMKGEAPLSRLSDIWSLGCVFFEYIVWLMYGTNEAERFNNDLKGKTRHDGTAPFYLRRAAGQAILNPEVDKWFNHMKRDPNGSDDTALGSLLSIIHDFMLTTGPIRDNWEATDSVAGPIAIEPGTRATARETLHFIDNIIMEAHRRECDYLLKGVGAGMGQRGQRASGPTQAINLVLPVRTSIPSQQQELLSPQAAMFRQPRSTGARNFPLSQGPREVIPNRIPQKDYVSAIR